jgi:hypothetical protein
MSTRADKIKQCHKLLDRVERNFLNLLFHIKLDSVLNTAQRDTVKRISYGKLIGGGPSNGSEGIGANSTETI